MLKKDLTLLKTIRIMPSKRSPQKRSLHDSVVRRLARSLKAKYPKSKVYADVQGFPTPDKIGQHIPDIWVKHQNGRELIIEVETEDTINTAHAKSQARSFRGYANLNAPRVGFEVVLAEKYL